MKFFAAVHMVAVFFLVLWLLVDLMCTAIIPSDCNRPLTKLEVYGIVAALVWCISFVTVASNEGKI